MLYVIRARKLVKIVELEQKKLVHLQPKSGSRDHPLFPHKDRCLLEFQKLSKRYTSEVAGKTLAIAKGSGFIVEPKAKKSWPMPPDYTDCLGVGSPKGLILLTPTGYINELAGAVGKLMPLVAVIISILALLLSIFALYNKDMSDKPDFDELLRRASQPVTPSGQTNDQKSGNYTDKQTHQDTTEDTSDSQSDTSRESSSSTDPKNPQ